MPISTIICSVKDPASMNIKNFLLEKLKWSETGEQFDGYNVLVNQDENIYLVTIKEDIIYSDYLSSLKLDTKRFIFASRHSSKTKMPSLHVHFTGNWGPNNPYGGKPRSLSVAEPVAAGFAFLKLVEMREKFDLKDFLVSYEVTHHGPTEIDIPMFFIELGSSEEQWRLKKPAEIIASIILEIAKYPIEVDRDVAIGFGGTHYAPSFSRIVQKNRVFMSHMIPKHELDYLDSEMLEKMINRSSVRPTVAILDWKGMRSIQRKKVLTLLEETDLEIMKA
ncbi:MAG: D-aminoacyl-tRNA deacylase [Candidatus Njordarchaeia archaeon]